MGIQQSFSSRRDQSTFNLCFRRHIDMFIGASESVLRSERIRKSSQSKLDPMKRHVQMQCTAEAVRPRGHCTEMPVTAFISPMFYMDEHRLKFLDLLTTPWRTAFETRWIHTQHNQIVRRTLRTPKGIHSWIFFTSI